MTSLFRRDPLGVATVVLAVVAIGAAVLMARHEVADPVAADPRPADARTEELRRCRALGVEGADDDGCRAAWAESRRRFFGAAEARP